MRLMTSSFHIYSITDTKRMQNSRLNHDVTARMSRFNPTVCFKRQKPTQLNNYHFTGTINQIQPESRERSILRTTEQASQRDVTAALCGRANRTTSSRGKSAGDIRLKWVHDQRLQTRSFDRKCLKLLFIAILRFPCLSTFMRYSPLKCA